MSKKPSSLYPSSTSESMSHIFNRDRTVKARPLLRFSQFGGSLYGFFLLVVPLLFSFNAQAAYVFQTVAGEAFDPVTTDVVWSNDSGQTNYPLDDDYQLVNIGFTFYLGETGYTQVRILSNGALHFGADQGFHKDYTNEALAITGVVNGPGFEEPADRAVLGYWDDLEPSLGGTVRYGVLGSAPNRRFVASWENVPRYNNASLSYSFQIVLFENGNIRYRYGSGNANGSSATIGIEVDNSDFTQYSYNSVTVGDANDILWIREFPPINNASASCANTELVTLVFDSPVSPPRAADPTNYSLDNGATISAATLVNPTTVQLTTSTLSVGTTYTLSTTYPSQSTTFVLGTLSTSTFSDQFSNRLYSNNDGSALWTGNWIEVDDDGSPTSGNVTINGNELRMDDRPDSGGEPSIYREADLSAFTSATLTFDYNTTNSVENGDLFEVLASADGGASYSVIASFNGDASGSASIDISSYIAANTRIRFTIENNYGGNGERMEIDNVTITATSVAPCIPVVDRFEFLHDGSAINCLNENVTLRVLDASGGLVNDYTGTVNLSFSSGNGSWYIGTGQGSLTNAVADSGTADYTFVAADLGQVTLQVSNTRQISVDLDASEGAFSDDDSEGLLTFRPYGFVFSPNPVATQIAGRPFSLTLTAAGQTPAQPECGVIEEYNGIQALSFWSDYSFPITSPTLVSVDGAGIATSEAASAPQNVTFNSGVATVNVQYNDVGRIGIHAKDETGIGEPVSGNVDEIIGGIVPFVVRPFGYDLQITDDPYADDENDPAYAAAGESVNIALNNIELTVRSVIWDAADDLDNDGVPDPAVDLNADAIPDSGADLSGNAITPNISLINGQIDLFPSVTNPTSPPEPAVSNGNLGDSVIEFLEFPPPLAANAGVVTIAQSWDEVGILQIDARTTDFMGGGQDATGQRINIGRFIPYGFVITAPVITPACTGFTYAGYLDGVNPLLDKNGQTFDVSGTISAVNLGGNTTQNYTGVFARLTGPQFVAQGVDDDTGINASGQVNFATGVGFVNGTSNYSSPNTDYQYPSFAAPFNLRLDLAATDDDGVSGSVSSNAIEVRLGRLRLRDVYGPETSDLEMPLLSEFFNGTDWVTNAADNCTTYVDTDASFDLGSYTDNLNNGETAIFSPNAVQTLTNGVSDIANGLWYSAPGAGEYGSVRVNLNLAATQQWLQFDWDGDNSLDPASGTLNFGYYRGSDRVIYWREF